MGLKYCVKVHAKMMRDAIEHHGQQANHGDKSWEAKRNGARQSSDWTLLEGDAKKERERER